MNVKLIETVGDDERVRQLLADTGADISKLTIKEDMEIP